MEHVELVVLFLLVAVSVLTALARLLGVPYPIMLVVGGSLVGFAPGVPEIELDPDLVLLIFLPPLLFNAAYFSSLRDLRAGLRPITLNAVGLVLVTTVLVAVVAHAAIEGLPWAAAFALGAIVSPTDPLAATAIMRRLGAPRRLVSVVEGEALVNDGTALVVYRTAVVAVGGAFSLLDATWDFVVNAAGGIAIGVAVGFALVKVFRKLMDDDVVGVVLSLAAGYIGYLPAEEIGVSGVLAAVAVGLIVGRRSPELSTPASRLRGYAFWEVLVFLLNAVLFILVGLQLPTILEEQERSGLELVGLGVLVSVAVIGARMVWVIVTPLLLRLVDRREVQRARRTTWRFPAPRFLDRAARRGLAGRRPCAAAGFPRARADHLADAVRHLRHARGPGPDVVVGARAPRDRGRRRRRARGAARAPRGDRGGDRTPRAAG